MARTLGSKNRPKNAKIDTQETTPGQTRNDKWLLCINNPTSLDLDPVETLKSIIGDRIKYCKWAREEGGDTEGDHVHLLFILSEQVRFSAVKKAFPRAHVEEEIKGTIQQCLDYIGDPDYVHAKTHKVKGGQRKGGTCSGVWEYGSLEGVQLGRTRGGNSLDQRLNAIRVLIDAGASPQALYDADFPLLIRYGRPLLQYQTKMDIQRHQELSIPNQKKESVSARANRSDES